MRSTHNALATLGKVEIQSLRLYTNFHIQLTITFLGIGTHARMVSSSWEELSTHVIQACRQVELLRYIFCSTRYPSLLGRQRLHGVISLPDTFIPDRQWEMKCEPQTF